MRPNVVWDIDEQASSCTYFANRVTWSSGDECPHWRESIKNATYEN